MRKEGAKSSVQATMAMFKCLSIVRLSCPRPLLLTGPSWHSFIQLKTKTKGGKNLVFFFTQWLRPARPAKADWGGYFEASRKPPRKSADLGLYTWFEAIFTPWKAKLPVSYHFPGFWYSKWHLELERLGPYQTCLVSSGCALDRASRGLEKKVGAKTKLRLHIVGSF